jgi:hypothetical protein
MVFDPFETADSRAYSGAAARALQNLSAIPRLPPSRSVVECGTQFRFGLGPASWHDTCFKTKNILHSAKLKNSVFRRFKKPPQ